MIESVIRWSVNNRVTVLMMAVLLGVWGLWSLRATPVDAIPDLSDVQVIVRTSFPGQAPEVVEAEDAQPLGEAEGRVELREVTFGFGRGGEVLEGVSFAIEAGATVAVVGPSRSISGWCTWWAEWKLSSPIDPLRKATIASRPS